MEQLDLIGDAPAAQPSRAQQARDARDQGMKQAVDHADAMCGNWSERAYAYLRTFVAPLGSGALLTGERIREYAQAQGLKDPPDKRAWGAVMRRAARAGVLRKQGWTTAEDPKVHCNPVSQWMKP